MSKLETQANIEIQGDKNLPLFQSYFQTQSAKFTLACEHQTVL